MNSEQFDSFKQIIPLEKTKNENPNEAYIIDLCLHFGKPPCPTPCLHVEMGNCISCQWII